MKKPTLKQLKKRPALWIQDYEEEIYIRITMPNDTMTWLSHALDSWEFAGWL